MPARSSHYKWVAAQPLRQAGVDRGAILSLKAEGGARRWASPGPPWLMSARFLRNAIGGAGFCFGKWEIVDSGACCIAPNTFVTS
jgi:hypothetical protein